MRAFSYKCLGFARLCRYMLGSLDHAPVRQHVVAGLVEDLSSIGGFHAYSAKYTTAFRSEMAEAAGVWGALLGCDFISNRRQHCVESN